MDNRQNILQDKFRNWLINQAKPRLLSNTADEYITCINKVNKTLYGLKFKWNELIYNIYPILVIHFLCAKKWDERDVIDPQKTLSELLKQKFVSSVYSKKYPEITNISSTLSGENYKTYLNSMWDSPKKATKYKDAFLALLKFLEIEANSDKRKLYSTVKKKLDWIKELAIRVLSFDYIKATENEPMRIFAKNGARFLTSDDLVFYFGCCRNTIQKLHKDKAINYSLESHHKYKYSIDDINKYLKEKHSYFMNKQNQLDNQKEKHFCQIKQSIKELDLKKLKELIGEIQENIKDPNTKKVSELLLQNMGASLEELQDKVNFLEKEINDKKDIEWLDLEEILEKLNFELKKKKIQNMRTRGKLTYTQYSNKKIKYLSKEINNISKPDKNN